MFCEKVNNWKLLTIFAKTSILDWDGVVLASIWVAAQENELRNSYILGTYLTYKAIRYDLECYCIAFEMLAVQILVLSLVFLILINLKQRHLKVWNLARI